MPVTPWDFAFASQSRCLEQRIWLQGGDGNANHDASPHIFPTCDFSRFLKPTCTQKQFISECFGLSAATVMIRCIPSRFVVGCGGAAVIDSGDITSPRRTHKSLDVVPWYFYPPLCVAFCHPATFTALFSQGTWRWFTQGQKGKPEAKRSNDGNSQDEGMW